MFTKWPVLFALVFLSYGCGKAPSDPSIVTIATAANMQFAMEALSEQFTTQTGIPCRLVVSSSGKLTAQIKEGAPYDLFVAANMKYPEEIYQSGLAATTPSVYAYGQLVLWTMDADIRPTLSHLNNASIQRIAVANPKTAPYGQAAFEVLQYHHLDTIVQEKLVFGESIAQTNQFIITQAADIGFTAMSVVRSPRIKGQGNWTVIDQQYHQPIAQGLILLKTDDAKAKLAKQFFEFLSSKEAKSILEGFGYLLKE